MANTKKEVTEIVSVTSLENFELQAKITAGVLETNAKELKEIVSKELQNYSVDRYIDKPEMAKADKSALSKAKDVVAKKRIEVSKEWNKPLDIFLDEMKSIEKMIDDGYKGLNYLVKEAEEKEKAEKKEKIEGYWETLGFNLVSLDKIFNPKWLNKSFSMKNVMLECEEKIEKITSELATLKALPEDAETICAFYLDCLDISKALNEANRLKSLRVMLQVQQPIAEIKLEPVVAEVVKDVLPREISIIQEKLSTETQPKVKEIMSFNLQLDSADIGLVYDFCEKKDINAKIILSLTESKEKLVELRRFIDAKGIDYVKVD